MKNLIKIVIVATLILSINAGPAYAQNTDLSNQVKELLDQISKLQTRLQELRAEQQEVRSELQETISFTRSLFQGATGDDVEELQRLLAENDEIYPEGLVTGYFGPLTTKAVERLQAKFGLEQVGRVGPQTMSILNQLANRRGPGSSRVLDKVLVDQDNLDDDVDLSEFTPGVTGVLVCHKAGLANSHTIAVGGPAVRAHLAHGDTLGSCDDDEEDDEMENENIEEAAESAIEDARDAINDAQEEIDEAKEEGGDTEEAEDLLSDAEDKLNEAEDALEDEEFEEAIELAEDAEDLAKDAKDAVEDEDETGPTISEIEVNTSTTTATISWETNEDSDSKVYYSTESGFDLDDDDTESEDSDNLTTEHEITLEDLEPDTTYYFIIQSEDESGNDTESEEDSFTTDEE